MVINNDKHHIEWVLIVNIEINIYIAISFKFDDRNKLKMHTIYLDSDDIYNKYILTNIHYKSSEFCDANTDLMNFKTSIAELIFLDQMDDYKDVMNKIDAEKSNNMQLNKQLNIERTNNMELSNQLNNEKSKNIQLQNQINQLQQLLNAQQLQPQITPYNINQQQYNYNNNLSWTFNNNNY